VTVAVVDLHSFTVYHAIRRNAALYGSALSLRSGEHRIGHRALLGRVDGLVHGLWRAGVEFGDRLAILGNNSPEYVFLLCAAARLGAIVVPINWRLKAEEVDHILRDAAPKALFVDPEYLPIAVPFTSERGFIGKRYVIGEREEGFEPMAALSDDPGEVTAGKEPGIEDPYLIVYTAAVHGSPRGAVLSHRNVLASNLQYACSLGLTRGDVHIALLPLFHIAGLGMLLATMHAGGANLLTPKFDVDLALDYIEEDKATHLIEFPPILKTLLDKADEKRADLSSLRCAVGLDQTETVKRFEDATGATYWTGYGQSETTGFVTFSPYFERAGSAGSPNVVSRVGVHGEDGALLEPGKVGEIVVRGPMVFSGYWNREEDNRRTFRGGWHHTGDMGHLDADGYLWYAGRAPEKELIKTGGENVYPAEVEKAILEHPKVGQVAVIGVPDPEWGEAVKAVCVLSEGGVEGEEIAEFVANRIARYKKPRHVVFVPALPKKADGSVDRQKVKTLYG